MSGADESDADMVVTAGLLIALAVKLGVLPSLLVEAVQGVVEDAAGLRVESLRDVEER